jgi:nicotinate-nucleotide--dimethylbenzimidazole phosphoribosyltransferase
MESIHFNIEQVSDLLKTDLQHKIDFKTKPLGALGVIEKLALQIGVIQNSLTPQLHKPTIVVFASDHGIAKEGVSAYPPEVTYQMVMNFLQGGAAINVFSKQNNIDLMVVDAGVNHDFSSDEKKLIPAKIAKGTASFLIDAAMTDEQCHAAILKGAEIVTGIHEQGCNVIGFGEMGIGNTSAASCLMSLFCNISIEECVGKGTGVNNEQLKNKIDILSKAIQNYKAKNRANSPTEYLHYFGGFEMAMMAGAMLKAAELKMLVLVDGFICTAAFLAAKNINEYVMDYAIFCHQSEESGHSKILKQLGVSPLLSLNMRLGEGTGVAVAYPIIESAVSFLNNMASFESAGVSTKS